MTRNRTSRILMRFGDVDPTAYGGGVVFVPESEDDDEPVLAYTRGAESDAPDADEDDPDVELTVYSTGVPRDVLAWYDWIDVDAVAGNAGEDVDEWLDLARSSALEDRVRAIEDIASYYGWHEIDPGPATFTVAELDDLWELT